MLPRHGAPAARPRLGHARHAGGRAEGRRRGAFQPEGRAAHQGRRQGGGRVRVRRRRQHRAHQREEGRRAVVRRHVQRHRDADVLRAPGHEVRLLFQHHGQERKAGEHGRRPQDGHVGRRGHGGRPLCPDDAQPGNELRRHRPVPHGEPGRQALRQRGRGSAGAAERHQASEGRRVVPDLRQQVERAAVGDAPVLRRRDALHPARAGSRVRARHQPLRCGLRLRHVLPGRDRAGLHHPGRFHRGVGEGREHPG